MKVYKYNIEDTGWKGIIIADNISDAYSLMQEFISSGVDEDYGFSNLVTTYENGCDNDFELTYYYDDDEMQGYGHIWSDGELKNNKVYNIYEDV